jgi:hypothetical protein
MQTTPIRPDQLSTTLPEVPRKKSHRGWVIVGVIVAVIAVSSMFGSHATQPSGTPNAVQQLSTALDQNPQLVAQFCSAYNTEKGMGLSDGTIMSALQEGGAFNTFAGQGLSDQEVFDTVTERC